MAQGIVFRKKHRAVRVPFRDDFQIRVGLSRAYRSSWGTPPRLWQEDFFQDHFALPTVRANSGINPGYTNQHLLPAWFVLILIGQSTKKLLGSQKLCLSVSIAQDSIMSDLDKLIR